MWGSASDNARVYVSNNNFFNLALTQPDLRLVPNVKGATKAPVNPSGGLVAALDTWSGNIIW